MTLVLRRILGGYLALAIITGILYPLLITGLGQLALPGKASGSVVLREGKPIGSDLFGQAFSDPAHFWSRPSATTPQPYHGGSSAASNLGPTNPALARAVGERIKALRAADPSATGPVPVDLVTASGSGLDPHISPAAAEYQVSRVARARGWPVGRVRQFVLAHTEGRTFGILGEPRVNVLALNLALDAAG
jgi:K+-transporting ATPase ATPase C chain